MGRSLQVCSNGRLSSFGESTLFSSFSVFSAISSFLIPRILCDALLKKPKIYSRYVTRSSVAISSYRTSILFQISTNRRIKQRPVDDRKDSNSKSRSLLRMRSSFGRLRKRLEQRIPNVFCFLQQICRPKSGIVSLDGPIFEIDKTKTRSLFKTKNILFDSISFHNSAPFLNVKKRGTCIQRYGVSFVHRSGSHDECM